MLLATTCNGQGEETLDTDKGPSPGNIENSNSVQLDDLQQTDETTLVQLGRTYSHSFPAGFYQEYALNNVGDQPLTVTLTPTDEHTLAFVILQTTDSSLVVLEGNASPARGTEYVSFMPEAGVNYRLRVYEVTGSEGEYELTIVP